MEPFTIKANCQKFIMFVYILFIINLLPYTFGTKVHYVSASTTYYAQISTNQTNLYASPDEDSVIFTLPQTYFVELLSEQDNYYYAKYSDLYGYVKKEQVKPIKNIPQTPFLQNISFRVFVPSGATLRSTPQNLGATNLVYAVPFLETNLLYYGTAIGEEAISKKGNIWYYCKYYVNNLSYSGYLYSPLCDSLSTIPTNQEIVEYLETDPQFDQISSSPSTSGMEGLSSTTQTIIIIAVSLPCLLFIYLLFKPTKIAEQQSQSSSLKRHSPSHKKKISRLKHSDYFEFDDDFLN